VKLCPLLTLSSCRMCRIFPSRALNPLLTSTKLSLQQIRTRHLLRPSHSPPRLTESIPPLEVHLAQSYSVVRDNMNEVVVWNPWKEGAESIGDFAPKDGYKEMICVEAGAVKGWVELGGGETWEGGQVVQAFY